MTPDVLIQKLLTLFSMCVERDMSPITVARMVAQENIDAGRFPPEYQENTDAEIRDDMLDTIKMAQFFAMILLSPPDDDTVSDTL